MIMARYVALDKDLDTATLSPFHRVRSLQLDGTQSLQLRSLYGVWRWNEMLESQRNHRVGSSRKRHHGRLCSAHLRCHQLDSLRKSSSQERKLHRELSGLVNPKC